MRLCRFNRSAPSGGQFEREAETARDKEFGSSSPDG